MNTASKLLAGLALSIIAAAGAQAETYDGVHSLVSANSRATVKSEATVAARSDNPYAEGFGQGVTTVSRSTDRAAIRAGAVVAAHSVNPYAEGYSEPIRVGAGNIDRAAVRAQARAAARSNDLAL